MLPSGAGSRGGRRWGGSPCRRGRSRGTPAQPARGSRGCPRAVRGFANSRGPWSPVIVRLPVTRVATLHVVCAADSVFLFESSPDLELGLGFAGQVFLLRVGMIDRAPAHVGHLILRTQMTLGLAVAVETPAHAERLGLMDDVHVVDAAVAGDAADAAVDVGAVVEECVVGEVVDLGPLDREAALPALADRAEVGTVLADDVVAVHADLCGGDGGEGGFLDGGVAVAAVEAELADVDGVAVGDGLFGRVADGGGARGGAQS